jgi:hypothetical protein
MIKVSVMYPNSRAHAFDRYPAPDAASSEAIGTSLASAHSPRPSALGPATISTKPGFRAEGL